MIYKKRWNTNRKAVCLTLGFALWVFPLAAQQHDDSPSKLKSPSNEVEASILLSPSRASLGNASNITGLIKALDKRAPGQTASASSTDAKAAPATYQHTGPIPKPEGISPVKFLEFQQYSLFQKARTALRSKKFTNARAFSSQLSDPTAQSLIDWLYLRDSDSPADLKSIVKFLHAHPDWPDTGRLHIRAEKVIITQSIDAKSVLSYFSSYRPKTGAGIVALAKVQIEVGNITAANKLIVDAWREQKLSAALEQTAINLCKCISTALDKERMDIMSYRRSSPAMMRAAKRLGASYVEIAQAHNAIAKRAKNANQQYQQVPKTLRKDLALQLSRATWLRRNENDEIARKLILDAPKDKATILDPEAWWTERRLLARRALGSQKLIKNSYKLAAEHALSNSSSYADAEFLSGWIALRHLKNPKLATQHFNNLKLAVKRPISIARAEYWLAQAADANGQTELGNQLRQAAAQHGITFYGQLARNQLYPAGILLDLPSLNIEQYRKAEIVEQNPLMRAARLLSVEGDRQLAAKFLIRLSYGLSDMGQLGRVGNFANQLALPQVGVRIGKIGLGNGAQIHDIAYPISDFPALIPPPRVETALLLALTRQESEFAWQASSRAGARGLMQVMPATGKMLARQAGIAYSLKRLGEDPHYNARLGSNFLSDLIDRFNGSYVLAIASYNAGPGRIEQWIERFGDPRNNGIDMIDWIESIPFNETRNYVQRVMENVQVYRARLSNKPVPLRLSEDLMRGSR